MSAIILSKDIDNNKKNFKMKKSMSMKIMLHIDAGISCNIYIS